MTTEYEPNNFKQEFHGTVTLRQALAVHEHPHRSPAKWLVDSAAIAKKPVSTASAPRRFSLSAPTRSPRRRRLHHLFQLGVYANRTSSAKSALHRRRSTATGPTPRRPIRARLHDSQPQEVPAWLAPAPAPAACLPAAGKTGTSTTPGSRLHHQAPLHRLVGFDNNQSSRLKAPRRPPIWTEFMKRAHRYREYAARRSSNRQTASPPSISILSTTATGACPPRPEVFIAGTSPSNLPLPQQAAVRSLADAWSRPPLPASHPRHPRPNRPPRAHPSRRRIRCRLNNCNYPPQEGRRGFDRFEYI